MDPPLVNNKIIDICRACLTPSSNMKYLLETNYETVLLVSKFSSVANIKIQLDAKYPSYLCHLCETKILNFYDFQQQCQKSNDLINECLSVYEHRETSLVEPDFINVNSDLIEALDNTPQNELNSSNSSNKNGDIIDSNVFSEPKENDMDHCENETSLNISSTGSGILNVSEDILLEDGAPRQKPFRRMRLKQYCRDDVEKALQTIKDKLYHQVDCIFCRFKAISNRSLATHVLRVHSEYKGKWCSSCNIVIENQTLHNKQVHLEDLKCPFCQKFAKRIGNLVEHLQCHAVVRNYRCDICTNSFISLRLLRRHKEIHAARSAFKCEVCKRKFLKIKALRLHMAEHESDYKIIKTELKIESDDDDDGNQDNNESNSEKIAEPLNFCKQCNKRVRSLPHHNDKCHSENPKPKAADKQNLCPLCGKQFSSESKLNMHLRSHSGETPYRCQYCDKGFTTRNIVVAHERTHTGEKPYMCTVCGKSFAQSSVLKTHSFVHSGRPEQCTLCAKRFCRPSELRLHMRAHTDEKPYNCDQCGQDFRQKSHLMEHLKTHDDARPYACEYCQKSFKNPRTLKCHVQIHTGEKPYKCSQCSYACRQHYSLTKHMIQHEQDRPDKGRRHKCEICDRSCLTLAHLISHQNRFHPNLFMIKDENHQQLTNNQSEQLDQETDLERENHDDSLENSDRSEVVESENTVISQEG